jgi:Ulp1 family protease
LCHHNETAICSRMKSIDMPGMYLHTWCMNMTSHGTKHNLKKHSSKNLKARREKLEGMNPHEGIKSDKMYHPNGTQVSTSRSNTCNNERNPSPRHVTVHSHDVQRQAPDYTRFDNIVGKNTTTLMIAATAAGDRSMNRYLYV